MLTARPWMPAPHLIIDLLAGQVGRVQWAVVVILSLAWLLSGQPLDAAAPSWPLSRIMASPSAGGAAGRFGAKMSRHRHSQEPFCPPLDGCRGGPPPASSGSAFRQYAFLPGSNGLCRPAALSSSPPGCCTRCSLTTLGRRMSGKASMSACAGRNSCCAWAGCLQAKKAWAWRIASTSRVPRWHRPCSRRTRNSAPHRPGTCGARPAPSGGGGARLERDWFPRPPARLTAISVRSTAGAPGHRRRRSRGRAT